MAKVHSHGLIGAFARHPVAANLTMIIILLLGAVALMKLNVQFFPNFQLEMIQIRVIWPGANAEDVERSITRSIERALRTEDGLDQMSSTSSEGMAVIMLKYLDGTNMIEALERVRQKVTALRNLPEDAQKPVIEHVQRYERIAKITLVSEQGDLMALRAWAQRFERELLDAGVDRVIFSGLPDLRLRVEIPQENLIRSDQTLPQWGSLIARQSRDLPLGSVGERESARDLRFSEKRESPTAVANLSVPTADVPDLRLRDIGTARWAVSSSAPLEWLGQARAVTLEVQRSENGNTLKSAKIVYDWLQRARAELPQGMKLVIHDETWSLVKQRIMLLVNNGLGGLLLVLAVLFIFMNGRVAFWVAVGIPTSFAATLAIMWLTGGSINMVSLFALIMALGIIVDDAIVVGEDALAHYERGEPPLQAAEGGAHRMAAPVTAASLTTIAAFLPLMMLTGTMGNILEPIPMVMVAVVAASLLESFLVLPGHLRHALAKIDPQKPNPIRQKLERGIDHFRFVWFRAVVRWALANRALVLSATLGLMILAIGLLAGGRVPFTFFPSPESNKVSAYIQFVAGTPAEDTQAYAQRVRQAALDTADALEPGMLKVAILRLNKTRAATGQHYATVDLEFVDSDQRQTRNTTFIEEWRKRIGPEPPGLDSLIIATPKMGPQGADFEVQMYGAPLEKLKAASLRLQQALSEQPGVYAIEDDLPFGKVQWVLHLTPAAQALGMTVEDLAAQLSSAFASRLVQIFTHGEDEVELRVQLPQAQRTELATWRALQIRTPQGWAPLDQLVHIEEKQGFEVLRHVDGRLGVTVRADVDHTRNNANALRAQFEKTLFPQLAQEYGVKFSEQGRARDQKATLENMKIGMLVGLALIYLILAWVLASYGWPLLVMMAIPFGLIGAIFGHWVMGLDLTILSLFGFFALAGIVVNDSIILVTFYKQLRQKGMAVQQALEEASVQRVRAVLLTSLTTIGGLLPLLFEKSLQAQFLIPMATAIAFGLMASTLLILLVVPVLLSLYEQLAGEKMRA
ncbi:Multidrug efflux pump subunit AcrB [Sulfurivirga caldicuralii]|uniref:Multidrug efflux pump subunit AcrB n=1 Tax=Sulfurivirga caldicuralii TaxID=364032 RepID=A0A1N6GTP7_9GAMM|nr:efflux RND transporter permease subunit [Sulfurivirga caldicuralii]SIO10971.1 Multidrug efflux pump subunit AcrB [Sulfurivirga caldicuralii]